MTQAEPGHARFADYVELTKPRLSLLSVLTALVGYFAARPAHNPAKVAFLAVGHRQDADLGAAVGEVLAS